MLMMSGMGMLATAVGVPEAQAHPSPPAAPAAGPGGPYLFQDEFDGPQTQLPTRASGPCRPGRTTYSPGRGIYRDDRRNVFQDGNSNLVIMATRDFDRYYSGKVRATGGHDQHHLGSTDQARLPVHRPVALVLGCQRGSAADGEVDFFEWYGNGDWAPGTTVHAASNGKTWKADRFPGWWTAIGTPGKCIGVRTGSTSRTTGTIFHRSNKPIHVHGGAPDDFRWPFNKPAIGCRPCSPLRSVASAAAILPWATSPARCLSTTCAFGDYRSAMIT